MSMCNVLGVLGDNEDQVRATLEAAIALADAENARLTLVKTCDDGRAYVWITPFAYGGAYVPPPIDTPARVAHLGRLGRCLHGDAHALLVFGRGERGELAGAAGREDRAGAGGQAGLDVFAVGADREAAVRVEGGDGEEQQAVEAVGAGCAWRHGSCSLR